MTTIQGAAAPAASTASPATAVSGTVDTVALLPAPALAPMSDVQDGLTILYEMQAQMGASAVRDASTEAAGKDAHIKAQAAAFEAAMKRQADAQRKASGFWADLKSVASTVAKVAGVVAGVAAVALTGGAALPMAIGIAGVALSAGGMAVRELKILGKDSDAVGMWMELGGAGVAVGGAALAAVGVTAVAVASSGGSSAMQGVRTGAAITSAAGTATAAGAGVVVADYERDAEHAAADRQAATFAMDRLRFERGLILRSAQEGAEATKEALSATRSAIESCSNVTDVGIIGVRA